MSDGKVEMKTPENNASFLPISSSINERSTLYKELIYLPTSECATEALAAPPAVASWTALKAYIEASVAAIASGRSLVKEHIVTSRRAAVQSTAGNATGDDELTKHESYRLDTFTDVWAYDHIVNARELARNGFFYAGPGDRVQCAFCQGLLRNWEPGDRVDEQHAHHFTYCRFVQGHDVGNVSIPFWPLESKQTADGNAPDTPDASRSDFGITSILPEILDVAIEARRLLTFATWPAPRHLLPYELARAGFFYCGKEDAVRCYFCDGTGVDWRTNCNPWVEHAQCSPSCSFVQQFKGHNLVQQHRMQDPPPANSSKPSLAVDHREVRARMDSNKVRVLLSMDYPLDVIREVVQKRLATFGSDHETAEQLLDDVFQTHDEKQKANNAQNAASFKRNTCIDYVHQCNGARCCLSDHTLMLNSDSKNRSSLPEMTNKLICSFLHISEAKSVVRQLCTMKRQRAVVLLVALLVHLLGALNGHRQWPGCHLSPFELEITRTASRMGLLGHGGQEFTILLRGPQFSQQVHLQLLLPQSTSCCPVDRHRSLSQTSSWFGLAAYVDSHWVDGFDNVQVQISIDKPAIVKLRVLHDSHPVEVPSMHLSLSSTANAQCEGTAKASDKDCKAKIVDVKLHSEIADAYTVAAECDAEIKTAFNVNRFLAIKHRPSWFTHRSARVPAVDNLSRWLGVSVSFLSRLNNQLLNVVVCTGKVQWGASVTPTPKLLGSNLQRLAQLTTGSSQTVFDLPLFRLASLASWSQLGKMSALRCSSAGFHRKITTTSVGDDVACFSCRCTVEHWMAGIDPMPLHFDKCAQHCCFIAQPSNSGNVPIGTAGLATAPSVASSISSAADRSSAADWMSSLGLRPLMPQAARVLGAYQEAGLAAIASGSSLVRVLKVTSRRTGGILSSICYALQQHDDELAKQESYRLGTFADVWAYDHIVDARELARNGFFYAGPGDLVQCAFCSGLLRNWEPGYSVDELHAQHFTCCRFVQGHDVGNVPIPFWPLVAKQAAGVSAAVTEGPRHADGDIQCTLPKSPEFAIEARRLSTFATWPTTHHLQPEAMARSGFFYLGKDDAVRCFFCDVTVVDWQADCDPLMEHVRRFPSCPFVRLETGHDFGRQQRVNDRPTSSDRGTSASSCLHREDLGPPFSDFSTSISANRLLCQVCDEDPPGSSRTANVSAESLTYDPQDAFGTLTSSISARTCAHQVHDEPAFSTLRMSHALDSREVRARMDSSKVRILLDMDYPSYLIRIAIQKRLATCGSDHETPEQLLHALFLAEDERQQTSIV